MYEIWNDWWKPAGSIIQGAGNSRKISLSNCTTIDIKNDSIDIKSIKEYVFNNIISTLEEYKKELLQERLRQIQIKQK